MSSKSLQGTMSRLMFVTAPASIGAWLAFPEDTLKPHVTAVASSLTGAVIAGVLLAGMVAMAFVAGASFIKQRRVRTRREQLRGRLLR